MTTDNETTMQRRIGYLLWQDGAKLLYTVDMEHGTSIVVGMDGETEYEISIKEAKK